MSTVICQGFQPCLDTQLVETTTLRLKLVEPKSPTPMFPILDNPKQKPFLNEEMQYSKPFSPLRLNDKSLELCTESLGSETGSDTSEGSIFSFDLEYEKSFSKEQRNLRPQMSLKKANSRDFPPPLTTISGSNSLQVRAHREDGRLVMKATPAPSSHCYFQAERSQGRLRLTVLKNVEYKIDQTADEKENNKNVTDVEIQEDDEEEEEEEEEEESNENENYEDDEEEEEYEEEYECEGGGESDENLRGIYGNRKNVGMEMVIEKFQRPISRCKESGHGDKGLCSWEGLWVATS